MADKPKHRHTGHRERMKAEFLARGLEGWPDHRVLELLLFYTIPQGDVNDLAHELVERFGSLAGVLDASVEELKKVKGVGDHTAVFLRMLPAVLGRYQGARTRLSAIINSPEEAYAWLEPYFFGARNEMVYVLCLDGKRQVLGVRKVAEGSIELAEVNTRRIAEEAIGLRAAQIYVAHNHVSNLAIPSQADWLTTDTLRGALRPIGIELIDHLVFVDGDMVSLKDSEHLKSLQYV
ncbi:JAB domain-containing protein [Pseudoflavonifractor capillosus]|uniref:JAB domain-containing protein n=1 Tax=Pseudoflavonifractor capillosus TaxID=106588 RepID=UPI00195D7F85|nr:DNA repair protein RadC [Pseudoflavonifractor capillosus]MBM6681353.1 RadC family protein [Pseudoflavonifractor capillosus]